LLLLDLYRASPLFFLFRKHHLKQRSELLLPAIRLPLRCLLLLEHGGVQVEVVVEKELLHEIHLLVVVAEVRCLHLLQAIFGVLIFEGPSRDNYGGQVSFVSFRLWECLEMINLKLIRRVVICKYVLNYFMEEAPLLCFLGHEEAVINRHKLVVVNLLIMTFSMRKLGR
jgi:hypothetical protein